MCRGDFVAPLGRVDGFDQDEPCWDGHKGCEVLGGFLAPKRDTLEAFEFKCAKDFNVLNDSSKGRYPWFVQIILVLIVPFRNFGRERVLTNQNVILLGANINWRRREIAGIGNERACHAEAPSISADGREISAIFSRCGHYAAAMREIPKPHRKYDCSVKLRR